MSMPTTLTADERERFAENGWLLLADAVTVDQLDRLRTDMATWVDESRNHDAAYGTTTDGRARFDLQPGHCPERPGLRRVQAPSEVSDAYFVVLTNSRVVDAVADLIGPDVRHHHNKINSKQPGSATEVRWHQDFCFTPHTNCDLVTSLLFVDDVTGENGPLEVQDGSHRGPLHGLWHDGVFTGAVDRSVEDNARRNAVVVTGPAGSACLMHTRLMHGSTPNTSGTARTLFIAVYAAADSVRCTPNPVPNAHDGLIVRGAEPGRVRSEPWEIEIPEYPKAVSFFTQQAAEERAAI
jgi:ectoine hydroxylase-related dioxygenase (phytanoyl-CoA dioxygenase family)